MAIEYEQQTNVCEATIKWQCLLKQKSEDGSNKTRNNASCTWKLFIQVQGRNGISVYCSNITQWESRIIRPDQGSVFKWYRGISFLYSKGFHFAGSRYHTLRQCQYNAIQLCHWWCRCKICRHKNIIQCKVVSDCNIDIIGRQH